MRGSPPVPGLHRSLVPTPKTLLWTSLFGFTTGVCTTDIYMLPDENSPTTSPSHFSGTNLQLLHIILEDSGYKICSKLCEYDFSLFTITIHLHNHLESGVIVLIITASGLVATYCHSFLEYDALYNVWVRRCPSVVSKKNILLTCPTAPAVTSYQWRHSEELHHFLPGLSQFLTNPKLHHQVWLTLW